MRKLLAKQNRDAVQCENFALVRNFAPFCETDFPAFFCSCILHPLLQKFDKNCKNNTRKNKKNTKKMKNKLETKINLKLEII